MVSSRGVIRGEMLFHFPGLIEERDHTLYIRRNIEVPTDLPTYPRYTRTVNLQWASITGRYLVVVLNDRGWDGLVARSYCGVLYLRVLY